VVPRVSMGVVTKRIIPTCTGNLIPTVQLIVSLLSWFGIYVETFRDTGLNSVTEDFRLSRQFGARVDPVSA
jgi:hypothetical protein